jgi:hypothetical protein
LLNGRVGRLNLHRLVERDRSIDRLPRTNFQPIHSYY